LGGDGSQNRGGLYLFIRGEKIIMGVLKDQALRGDSRRRGKRKDVS